MSQGVSEVNSKMEAGSLEDPPFSFLPLSPFSAGKMSDCLMNDALRSSLLSLLSSFFLFLFFYLL